MAHRKQAQTAEYDQSTAGQAIASFTDFMTLYPQDPRVPETRDAITGLTREQAHGSLEIARFYEKRKRWEAARIYYNEVVNHLLSEPNSPYAEEARKRIDAIKNQLQPAGK
jgi:outer membrane protein assembly factor BamD (BamD/ComL family)